jgi:hypothetical protein
MVKQEVKQQISQYKKKKKKILNQLWICIAPRNNSKITKRKSSKGKVTPSSFPKKSGWSKTSMSSL